MAIYYLDGPTLATSTAVFTDVELTVCAADGMYSNGAIVRQQLNCSLFPQQTCGTCAAPCDSTISASGNMGVYLLDLDLGSTASDTGAIVITFDPFSYPDGIIGDFDNTKYNKLSSPTFGHLAGGSPTQPTYLGSTTSQSTCDGGVVTGTYIGLTEYNYVVGSGFVTTGLTQDVTVAAGDTALTSSAPGACVMVIPKPNQTPSTLSLSFYGVCTGTAFDVQVSCPAALTSLISTSVAANADDACESTRDSLLYIVPVTGTSAVPALHDWVFTDVNGANIAAQGFYGVNVNKWIQVSADGVVVAAGTCPVSYTIYIAGLQAACNTYCDGTNRLISVSKLSTEAYINVSAGTVISGAALTDGYYAYAETSTDTATGVYRIMELASNIVTSISVCSGSSCVQP